MMTKTLRRAVLAAAWLTIAAPAALPHGDHAPKHGGLVKASGETIIELVVQKDGGRIYVREDTDESPVTATGGKLIALLDGVRTEAALVPEADRSLVAKGVKLAPRTRVSVQVILAEGQKRVVANFAIP